MARSVLLSCDEVARSFGGPPLFTGLSFSLHEGDHVGLIGPNGAGKSTFLKILAGLEPPDSGRATRRKNVRVGLVPQSPRFEPGRTAAEVVEAALAADGRLDPHERELHARLVLDRAGFADPDVPTERLSGGWRARLAIAQELAREPDVLLLDEPTNHLDIDSILWLESVLQNEPRAFVAISHDRRFLDRVARRMLEINRVYPSGLFQAEGSYADFLEARDAQLASDAAYQDSLAGLVRREIAWLRRGAKARTTKSKARIQSAERSIEELEDRRSRSAVRSAGIEFTASGRETKRLWSADGVRIAFGERTILAGLDLVLAPGMRLGVLGPNGSGKTTLLRTILGEHPAASGTIVRAEGLRVVYFDQNRESLDPSLTLRRALAPAGDLVIYRDQPLHVASWAKRFLFPASRLESPVASLSGGERARIVLARMMLRPADLLILDEPTNDLDIPALEVLEESLMEFPGALVLVSHDRHLLDRVSTSLLALDGRGGAKPYADFDQWETDRGRQTSMPPASPGANSTLDDAPRPQAAKAPRAAARRLSYIEQREWEGMEARLLEAEALAAAARRAAEDPMIASDAPLLLRRHAELAELEAQVARLYARWAELEEKRGPGPA